MHVGAPGIRSLTLQPAQGAPERGILVPEGLSTEGA